MGEDPEPVVRLERYAPETVVDDAFTGLRDDVAAYGHLDPLATLEGLSRASGIPVGALARYVLARWTAGGAEGLLELGVGGVDHLQRIVEEAERDGTDEARLVAFSQVTDVVRWLRAGLDEAEPRDR